MVFAVLFLTNYNRLRERKKIRGTKLIKRTLSLLADRLVESVCKEKGGGGEYWSRKCNLKATTQKK